MNKKIMDDINTENGSIIANTGPKVEKKNREIFKEHHSHRSR